LNLFPDDPDGIMADLDTRVVGPGPIVQPKTPGVPGAGDDAVLDVTTRQRGPHVRAHVVDGLDLVATAKDSDEFAIDGYGLPLVVPKFGKTTNRLVFAHEFLGSTRRLPDLF
jgi:hypothetical protein